MSHPCFGAVSAGDNSSAHYFDAGITQKVGSDFQVGLDAFYKHARNVLDEGQFGQALILSSFNYREGEIYGHVVQILKRPLAT